LGTEFRVGQAALNRSFDICDTKLRVTSVHDIYSKKSQVPRHFFRFAGEVNRRDKVPASVPAEFLVRDASDLAQQPGPFCFMQAGDRRGLCRKFFSGLTPTLSVGAIMLRVRQTLQMASG